ncbi:adenylosuccinate lyase [Natranaerofaba carboxydovora]|uniref:adenylosuccinate lyase n=1 Tax=Natranaerofaba carboxydovora TaxID=2742683 RepID=UPI001F12CB06|nr:adenylosuccinate lyase [Natranaerofaba carboxydovora]UMZ74544.1 Adenylosuccinate lyase [Natranaerofaba carboxydovora]
MIERYTRPEMKKIWSLENKFKKWLEVEIYALEALSNLDVVPEDDVKKIRENASFEVSRILEIEEETRHDVIAFVSCVAESLGPEKRYLHYGLTSSDVVDTAMSALIKEACEVLLNDLDELTEALKEKAREHKDTVMIGRTHGVHAEPTTLGVKIALFYSEMLRNKERLERAKDSIAAGKISGAVGTYANVPPYVEEYVCEKMGLSPAPVSTQIIQRDRHAELMTTLAIIGGTLDKLATEIRGLQKSETREVEEPFYKGQKGSSAMPHKKNPVVSERISGLVRILRGNAQAALENQPLWHERDISHSSTERVIIPDSTIILNYILKQATRIIKDLKVNESRMEKNLQGTYGLVFSQQVLLKLIDKGVVRDDAYVMVQRNAMKSWEEERSFLSILKEDKEILDYLSEEELNDCFDPKYHLKNINAIFERLGI